MWFDVGVYPVSVSGSSSSLLFQHWRHLTTRNMSLEVLLSCEGLPAICAKDDHGAREESRWYAEDR